MFSIIAKLTARQGKEKELVEAITRLTKQTKERAGCVNYISHIAADNPVEIIIFEQYVDESELQFDAQNPHFKAAFEAAFEELLSKPIEVTILKKF